MANTGVFQVNIQTLNDGTTAVSGTGNDTATTTFQECLEAVLELTCVAVASAGIFVPKLQGSTDGGATYNDLTPTTGSPIAAVSATGTQRYRYKNLPPKVRTTWTKTSGTSVTVVAKLIGLGPQDSGSATAV
jgi:hypothetical protein